jgi:hypothetical protein
LGLEKLKDFSDIVMDEEVTNIPDVIDKLKSIYKTIDNLELYIGA